MTGVPDIVAAETHERGWLRAGGISALALGVGYIVIVVLYAQVGAPPRGGEAWLAYLTGKTTIWWAILGLSVLTDFLFVPVAVALYAALHSVNRSAMLVAVCSVVLFVVLDLAVTWPNYASLLVLRGDYAAATQDSQRAAAIAAAGVAASVLVSPLELVYAMVILSVGILTIGFVMLKGPFARPLAYLGMFTGALGTLSLVGPGILIIGASLLTTLWLLLVGYQLWRLGGVR
jgi:hypothetical protein